MENEKKFELNRLTNIRNQIYFLGTNHLSSDSGFIVEDSIITLNLNAVMIEFDELRYNSLNELKEDHTNIKSKKKDDVYEGLNDTEEFFHHLQNVQKEFGKILNVVPGIDMISALNTIKQLKIPLFFIDRPINETFERMEELNNKIKEEQKELISATKEKAFFSEDNVDEILSELKNPDFILDFLIEFKENYPKLFNIIITERNEYMADKIEKYLHKYPYHRILIIIGAGHLRGLFSLLEKKFHLKFEN